MKKSSKYEHFYAEGGRGMSITIYSNSIPKQKIGFISDNGNFYFDTDNEPVLIDPSALMELSSFIDSMR